MTVNEKIASLLAAANTKTGAGDSDLTGAVGTLIDGYGQGSHSPTISVAANGIITASCGGSSTTHTLSSADDADFIAGNIKDGVTLFGLLGTLSGGGDLPYEIKYGNFTPGWSMNTYTFNCGITDPSFVFVWNKTIPSSYHGSMLGWVYGKVAGKSSAIDWHRSTTSDDLFTALSNTVEISGSNVTVKGYTTTYVINGGHKYEWICM